MALATVADVKRILQDTSIADADLEDFLDAAESWVRRRLRRNMDSSTQATHTEYIVRQDAEIQLPELTATIDSVTIFPTGGVGVVGTVLDPEEYMVMDAGRKVRLLRGATWPDVLPDEVALWYDKVEVEYTPAADVPPAVRDATAILAAVWYVDAGSTGGGGSVGSIKSEHIGDYSYTLETGSSSGSNAAGNGDEGIPPKVMKMLRPWVRNRPRVV
jgi:hypothetical protein